MKIGVNIGYWSSAGPPPQAAEIVAEADRLGLDSVWTAEAYGSDVLTPLAWWGSQTSKIRLGTAIAQMSAREPAATAMAAITMDHLSQGRFILGLGVSGPQVVEGWYGKPFAKPLARTREYIEIIRRILRRDGPVTFDGEQYRLPLEGGTGLGKPLKLINHPVRSEIPIYVASLGPKNVEMTAEKADGWLPLFYLPEKAQKVWGDDLAAGAAKRSADLAPMEVVAGGLLSVGEGAEAVRELSRPMTALYVGGMGAKGKNFYNDLVKRYGYEQEAEQIQDLYLDGKKTEAAAAVPDALVDEVSLVGDRARIADRLSAFEDCGATTLILQARQPEALRALADLV